MDGHRVAMLGTGLIGDFYTMTLHGRRGRDRVEVVYSRSVERGEAFRERWGVPHATTSIDEAVEHPDVDTVVVGLPNHMHAEAIAAAAAAGKPVLCTKPLARSAAEAKEILDVVESAGVFAGYLEDLVYTPKTIKALAVGARRGDRRRDVGAQPGDPSRPAQRVVLGRRPGRRRVHRRPRLPLHRDHPHLRRQGQPAGRGDVLERHARPPDRGRGQRHRPRSASRAAPIGQFEVSWTFRGGMDLRDEVAGTEGTIWTNHFLRTGFEMFSSGEGGGTSPRRPRPRAAGCSRSATRSAELGYVDMFTDMFDAIDQGRQPVETFYDGYVVNAVMDACFRSAASRQWEPVELEWRRGTTPRIAKAARSEDGLVVIKEEHLPDGRRKLILKDPATGEFVDRVVHPIRRCRGRRRCGR